MGEPARFEMQQRRAAFYAEEQAASALSHGRQSDQVQQAVKDPLWLRAIRGAAGAIVDTSLPVPERWRYWAMGVEQDLGGGVQPMTEERAKQLANQRARASEERRLAQPGATTVDVMPIQGSMKLGQDIREVQRMVSDIRESQIARGVPLDQLEPIPEIGGVPVGAIAFPPREQTFVQPQDLDPRDPMRDPRLRAEKERKERQ